MRRRADNLTGHLRDALLLPALPLHAAVFGEFLPSRPGDSTDRSCPYPPSGVAEPICKLDDRTPKCRMIEIVDYRPDWPDEYERLAGVIRANAGTAIIALHHIGSTAVPGLAAKDVIDIQITVADLASHVEAGIEAAGFQLGRHISDHCAPGRQLSAEQLAKRLYNFAARPANIHVRQAGRFNQRYPLLCRDYLRTHEAAANAYAEIKRELAARFPDDTRSYYAIKDPTFDLLMVGAEEWAAATGWSQPPSD